VFSPEYQFKLSADGGLGIKRPVLVGVSGEVVNDKSERRPLCLDDVTFRFMTLDEDSYFLDSGEIHLRGGLS